jgi:hypothetical protein
LSIVGFYFVYTNSVVDSEGFDAHPVRDKIFYFGSDPDAKLEVDK